MKTFPIGELRVGDVLLLDGTVGEVTVYEISEIDGLTWVRWKQPATSYPTDGRPMTDGTLYGSLKPAATDDCVQLIRRVRKQAAA